MHILLQSRSHSWDRTEVCRESRRQSIDRAGNVGWRRSYPVCRRRRSESYEWRRVDDRGSMGRPEEVRVRGVTRPARVVEVEEIRASDSSNESAGCIEEVEPAEY